nr:calcium-binding protein PBP1-like [Ipomoea batatas]
MDRNKGVITFESLKKNCALLGLQDLGDDEVWSMIREGDLDEICCLCIEKQSRRTKQSGSEPDYIHLKLEKSHGHFTTLFNNGDGDDKNPKLGGAKMVTEVKLELFAGEAVKNRVESDCEGDESVRAEELNDSRPFELGGVGIAGRGLNDFFSHRREEPGDSMDGEAVSKKQIRVGDQNIIDLNRAAFWVNLGDLGVLVEEKSGNAVSGGDSEEEIKGEARRGGVVEEKLLDGPGREGDVEERRVLDGEDCGVRRGEEEVRRDLEEGGEDGEAAAEAESAGGVDGEVVMQ